MRAGTVFLKGTEAVFFFGRIFLNVERIFLSGLFLKGADGLADFFLLGGDLALTDKIFFKDFVPDLEMTFLVFVFVLPERAITCFPAWGHERLSAFRFSFTILQHLCLLNQKLWKTLKKHRAWRT